MAHHHAPSVEGKPWKVYYGSQVGTAPPTFMLFATRSLPQKSSLRRYLGSVSSQVAAEAAA